MTRVISGAVLIALAVGVVWFAPRPLFFLVGELLLVLAFVEYARLSARCSLPIVVAPSAAATLAASVAVGSPEWLGARVAAGSGVLEAVLMSAVVAIGAIALASWRAGPSDNVLGRVSASVFPIAYLGLPIGAMMAIRELGGPQVLFLLLLTIIASDTGQYYSGRAFGRRPLAPAVSPKKTLEGALGGFVSGALVLVVVGQWWLPSVPVGLRAMLGLAAVALGIGGDLFESMLKRSAGVKDSSTLIPGHGGILDRIDALLFAAPVYYVFLKYA